MRLYASHLLSRFRFTVATTEGRRIYVSRGLPRGEILYPARLGGDCSGADRQKVSNSINFMRESKVDHDFLVGRPYILRPVPHPRWADLGVADSLAA
jgi:hypothetical protein